MVGKVGIGEYVPGKYAKRKPGMVVNLDHLANPGDVADIVALAFNKKFKPAV